MDSPISNKTHSPSFVGDQGLLRKYDISGPRYTSYPTAAEFTKDFSFRDYLLEVQQGGVENISPLSLYIHIPFCHSLCYYCACNKIVTKDKNRSEVRAYLDHLQQEMALIRLQMEVYKRPVTQLHWGGGTPTFLNEAEMTELMHQTASYFNLSSKDSRDYSIEIDPRTVDENKIDLLKGLGFNRISLGVQDFNEQVQRAVNRQQSFAMVRDLLAYVRDSGFQSVNFDLMYGLPEQTEYTIHKTLDQTIELSPDRISYYNYAHLPQRFKSHKSIDKRVIPSAETKLGFLSIIIRRLTEAGYLYIGMDHFVKKGDRLAEASQQNRLHRNFQGYTLSMADDLVGLGVSSISGFDRIYAQNYKNIDEYYTALDDKKIPTEKGVLLSDEDALRREIIHQLLCYRCLDIRQLEQDYTFLEEGFWKHFDVCKDQLKPFEDDGILKVSEESINVNENAYYFLRNICMVFDQNLDKAKKAGFQFSKTL